MAGLPLTEGPSCVFVLFSIHDVMKAETILKKEGILFDTVPVPKEISSDCGMALLVNVSEKEDVETCLGGYGIEIKGVFRKSDIGYEVME